MTYELAKQLKEAGFSQPKGDHGVDYDGYWYNNARKVALGVDLMKDDKEPVYEPTLSELIEACGDRFGHLDKENITWIAFDNNGHGEDRNSDTPEEAVAKLWLELNKKQ